ncbi:hypothetical protein [Pseudomonas sp. 25 E 4]|nr:hypothetical protein [Pseudomonas sp. 25 E 4]
MAEQLRQARVGGAHAGLHANGAEADPQRQGVDEHAQRAVGTLAALQAPQQHGAEHHVLLAGHLAQYLCPGQMHQAGRAHAQLPRLLTQTQAQRRFQRQMNLGDAAAVTVHILQPEGQRRFVDIAEHLAEERFVLGLADAETGLGHVVAVLHRVGQLRAATGQAGAHFLHQHLQRGVVEQDVVQQQDADEATPLLGIGQAHQRSAGQVETIVTGVKALLQLRQSITALTLNALHGQRRLAQDHLHRFIQAFPEDRGAQDVIARDHAVQRINEGVQRRLVVEAQLHLQHVGIALGGCQVMVENAGLQRCQGIDILHVGDGHGTQDVVDGRLIEVDQRQHVRGDAFAAGADQVGRHLHFVLPAHRRGQGRQRGLPEQHAHIGAEVDLAHAFDQLDRQQGMPAQLEEVIVAPHPVELEQLLPDAREGAFHGALGRCVATAGHGIGVGGRQGLAVELAVGGQRELVEHHEGGRHHMLGQAQQQVVAQPGDIGRAVGNHVGHQAFVARLVFAGDNHRVPHARCGGQARLDFAQLDAEAANLHLVIVAPQVLDAAIGQQAAEVAGAVHAQAGGRVSQEALGVQFIAVQVAPRNAGAAHVQLADHAHGQRLALGVQHVKLQVGNAHANRADADQTRVRRLQGTVGHVHGGLGDAIHVHQLRSGVDGAGIPGFEHARLQRFTAENHLAQGMRFAAVALGRNQLAERARRLVEDAYAGLAEQRIAGIRRTADQLRHDQQLAAVHQRAPDFPHGKIEGERVEQRPHIGVIETEPVLGGSEQARDLTMLDHHALGQAGGTGGVDHVGQVRRTERHARVDDGLTAQVVQVDLRQVAHPITGIGLHQHGQRCAVGQGVNDAFLRVGRVDWHIAGAGLENAEQADDHFNAALHADRHAVVGADALGKQTVRDLVGAFVELAVGQALLVVAQRDGVGMGGGAGFDLLMDQRGVGIRRGAVVERVQQVLALGVRQDVQAAKRHVRSLVQGVGQAVQGDVQVVGHALRADGRVDHYRQCKVFAQVVDVDRERVVGAFLGTEHLDALGDVDHLGHVRRRAVAVIEHRAEQWRGCRHAAAALGQGEGCVLMLEQGGQARMGRLDLGAHALPAHIHAQRQRVDEHAQRPFTAFTGAHAAQHHGAEHHRVAAGHHAQHTGKGHVHQACHAHPQWPCQAAQTAAQVAVDGDARLVDALAVALHVLQAERQRRLIDIRQHRAKEGFMGLLADAMAHLGDVTAKRHRLSGQRLLASQV